MFFDVYCLNCYILQSSSVGYFAETTGCYVVGGGGSCDHMNNASISGVEIDGFSVSINFTYELNGTPDWILRVSKFGND